LKRSTVVSHLATAIRFGEKVDWAKLGIEADMEKAVRIAKSEGKLNVSGLKDQYQSVDWPKKSSKDDRWSALRLVAAKSCV
jgi:hypothetical protein